MRGFVELPQSRRRRASQQQLAARLGSGEGGFGTTIICQKNDLQRLSACRVEVGRAGQAFAVLIWLSASAAAHEYVVKQRMKSVQQHSSTCRAAYECSNKTAPAPCAPRRSASIYATPAKA